jgi:hypothetical protein
MHFSIAAPHDNFMAAEDTFPEISISIQCRLVSSNSKGLVSALLETSLTADAAQLNFIHTCPARSKACSTTGE